MQISTYDAYLLRRAMARMDVNDLKPDNDLINIILKNIDSDEGYNRLNWFITSDADLLQTVMKQDPTATPPARIEFTPQLLNDLAYVPELPKDAQLSDDALKQAESMGAWYKRTSEWASAQSPLTPTHFMQSATIWTLGLAIARRVRINLHESIYPHLYLLLVAESSRFAKSTGLNVFFRLVMETFDYMLIPGSATTEAMIELLSGQRPKNYDSLPDHIQQQIKEGRKFAGQRGILMDEYSSILSAHKKDYMAGFVELLLRLYDARTREQHYTRSGGLVTIEKPAISIMGATTPSAMARAISHESWSNGEMARYLIYHQEELAEYNDEFGALTVPDDIKVPLLKLHKQLPYPEDSEFIDPPAPMDALISPEAMQAYRAYTKALRWDLQDNAGEQLQSNYARMPIQTMKIALALASMDWVEHHSEFASVKIELGHWALAQQMTERSRNNLHQLAMKLNESSDNRHQNKIIELLSQYKGGLTVRDMCRRTSSLSRDIRSALEILMDAGQVEEQGHVPKTGRPTTFYRLVNLTD